MGSYLSSIFWSDQPQKPADAKYKQGIGSGPATQPQKKPIKANTIGSTRDARQRKKPKGKLNKDMIGKPGNFQVSFKSLIAMLTLSAIAHSSYGCI
jgi:hypothetical protein